MVFYRRWLLTTGGPTFRLGSIWQPHLTHFTKMFSFALKVRVFGTQAPPFHVVKNKNLKFGILYGIIVFTV